MGTFTIPEGTKLRMNSLGFGGMLVVEPGGVFFTSLRFNGQPMRRDLGSEFGRKDFLDEVVGIRVTPCACPPALLNAFPDAPRNPKCVSRTIIGRLWNAGDGQLWLGTKPLSEQLREYDHVYVSLELSVRSGAAAFCPEDVPILYF